MDTKLAEQMAIMVLRGEYAAARGLADWLCETVDATMIEPVVKIDVPLNRIRVALLYKDNVEIFEEEEQNTTQAIRDWLHTPYRPIALVGIESIQIYQLPE